MKRTLLIIIVVLGNLSFAYSQIDESRNFIYFFNDSVLYAGSIVKVAPLLGKTRFIVDSKEIKADMVKFYKDENGFYANSKMISNYSSSFMTRFEPGKVNVFRKESMAFGSGHFTATGAYHSEGGSTVEYFYNKGYGDVKMMSYKNLVLDLSDNPRSLMHLKKFKRIKSQKIIFEVVGAAAVLTGLALLDQETGVISGSEEKENLNVAPGLATMGIGAGLVFTGFLIGATRSNHLIDAIRTYNE